MEIQFQSKKKVTFRSLILTLLMKGNIVAAQAFLCDWLTPRFAVVVNESEDSLEGLAYNLEQNGTVIVLKGDDGKTFKISKISGESLELIINDCCVYIFSGHNVTYYGPFCEFLSQKFLPAISVNGNILEAKCKSDTWDYPNWNTVRDYVVKFRLPYLEFYKAVGRLDCAFPWPRVIVKALRKEQIVY